MEVKTANVKLYSKQVSVSRFGIVTKRLRIDKRSIVESMKKRTPGTIQEV